MDRNLELKRHRAITCSHYNFMRIGEQFLPSVVNTARADDLASKGELTIGFQQPLGQEQLYPAQQAVHNLFSSHLVFKHDFIFPCQIMYICTYNKHSILVISEVQKYSYILPWVNPRIYKRLSSMSEG